MTREDHGREENNTLILLIIEHLFCMSTDMKCTWNSSPERQESARAAIASNVFPPCISKDVNFRQKHTVDSFALKHWTPLHSLLSTKRHRSLVVALWTASRKIYGEPFPRVDQIIGLTKAISFLLWTRIASVSFQMLLNTVLSISPLFVQVFMLLYPVYDWPLVCHCSHCHLLSPEGLAHEKVNKNDTSFMSTGIESTCLRRRT